MAAYDDGTTTGWRDGKRHLWLVALVMPLLPFAAVALHARTGQAVWLWLGPIVILGVVPLVDLVGGLDRSNPPDDVIAALEADRYYRWLTFLFLPLQYAGFLVAMAYLVRGGLTVPDQVGLAITVGFIGGLGINTAHELGHKKESHERWLAKVALAQSCYGHFYIEHNRGHHVRVATPDDPASSRMGESFYRFWPRTVAGSLRSAWELERRRLARRQRSPWSLGNDVVSAWLMTAVLWATVVVWLGPAVLPFLVVQAVMGLTLLEAVNYLEHYGMLRARVGVGERERWEGVDPRHSWNSNNLATNVLLYHLQRHSDHHANPTRRYQALRDFPESPVLPTGYAGMILLALVPPAWRRVMDPRVVAHVDGDVARINVDPRRRDRVLARAAALAAAAPSSTAVPVAVAAGPTAVVDAPAYRCPGCGYTYVVAHGDVREGLPPGTAWALVPDAWCCPDCGVREKVDFVAGEA
ncbi:MAG: fatty acid desaturase [Candidatus Nanopelagicales bacterium]